MSEQVEPRLWYATIETGLPPEQAGKVAEWQGEIDERWAGFMQVVQHIAVGNKREVLQALSVLPNVAQDYAITRLTYQPMIARVHELYGVPRVIASSGERIDGAKVEHAASLGCPVDERVKP